MNKRASRVVSCQETRRASNKHPFVKPSQIYPIVYSDFIERMAEIVMDVDQQSLGSGDGELSEQLERLDLQEGSLFDKLAEFRLLLQNPRMDEEAVKVKEQCIYRCSDRAGAWILIYV